MKALIDSHLCSGCGLCVNTCPMVFELEGHKGSIKLAVVPDEAEATCLAAMLGCPRGAISIEL